MTEQKTEQNQVVVKKKGRPRSGPTSYGFERGNRISKETQYGEPKGNLPNWSIRGAMRRIAAQNITLDGPDSKMSLHPIHIFGKRPIKVAEMIALKQVQKAIQNGDNTSAQMILDQVDGKQPDTLIQNTNAFAVPMPLDKEKWAKKYSHSEE